MAAETLHLSLKDRLLLRNQYQFFAGGGDTNEREYNLRMVQVLEHVYESEYSDLTSVFSNPFSAEQGTFVLDVLSMYTSFEWAKQAGIKVPDEHSFLFDFHGFDGNNEIPYVSYARFLIEQDGRWESLKGKELNSHMPTLDRYEKMLASWNESANPHELAEADFVRIASVLHNK